jgi:ABC-type transport system involved in multi-copper enzyme maturation permease subunit
VISLPVIDRELRVQARRPITYYGRLWWGLAAGGLLAILLRELPRWSLDGRAVFGFLHSSLTTMILLLAPLVAADSISRERREGTLGLLFLTPLTSREIVFGKFSTHLVRLFYAWLLLVPFLILPLLMGGVGLDQFLISLAILISTLMTGLAAGMLASVVCVSFGSAVLWALLLGLLANVAVSGIVTNVPFWCATVTRNMDLPLIIRLFLLGPAWVFMPAQMSETFGLIFSFRHITWMIAGGQLGLSVLFLLLSISICTWRVAHHAESGMPTVRREKFRKRFMTPIIWKEALRRRMIRRMNRNPFIWLEYREPWARTARWVAMLGVIGIETLLLINGNGYFFEFFGAQFPILCVVVLAITLKSAGSFQFERENGAFELILVTPMRETEFVAGRLSAVTNYYRPVLIALAIFSFLGLFWLGPGLTEQRARPTINVLSFWLSVFSVPAAGLFFALRCKTFFPALVATAGFGVIGAPLIWAAFTNFIWYLVFQKRFHSLSVVYEFFEIIWWPQLLFIVSYHVALTLFCRKRAERLLNVRGFAL